MACHHTKPGMDNLHTLIDERPETEIKVLVFCINVENGIIKGEVSDLTTGEPKQLSPVTGTSQPLTELGLPIPPTQMTLIFTWGTAKVMLSGTTFLNANTNKFLGRFSTFKTAVNGGTSPVEEIGDTGTGTGTQT